MDLDKPLPPTISSKQHKLWFDGYLKEILDKWKLRIREDWDFLIPIDGFEGSGKTVFGQQIAYYLDPTFNLDRLVFTNEDFLRLARTVPKYSAIMLDEAYAALATTTARKKRNNTLMKMFREVRARNLFMIVVMPSFFEFTKYIALHRSKALFNVYTDSAYKRGFFKAYNHDKKTKLYIKGKEFYNYNASRANFHGKFPNHWIVNKIAYEDKKASATLGCEEENTSIMQAKAQRDKAIQLFYTSAGNTMTQEELGTRLDISRRTISDILRKKF